MPQSLADVLLHIVFSSKNRLPLLKTPELRERLDAYVVGTLQEEFRLLLERHGIKYDERYVWD